MAIYLYYGKIGDGKTYHVLQNEVVPAARAGRKIYTNLDGLNVRRLSQYVGREVDVVQWHTVEEIRAAFQLAQDDKEGSSLAVDRGALMIVDEAQMIFDSRQWKDTGPGTLRLCEYHRHFGLDIVFVTQAPGRLDKSLCRLANESLHVKNLRFLGSLFGRRYVINIRQTPWDRETMATVSGHFKPEIFALYRSSVVNARARVSKGAFKMAWIVAPAGIAIAALFFTRQGGFGFTRVARMQAEQRSAGVADASRPPAVGAGGSSLSSSVVGVPPAAVVTRRARPKRKIMMCMRKRLNQLPRVVGRVEVAGAEMYYLQLKDRVVHVGASALADYDLEGAL